MFDNTYLGHGWSPGLPGLRPSLLRPSQHTQPLTQWATHQSWSQPANYQQRFFRPKVDSIPPSSVCTSIQGCIECRPYIPATPPPFNLHRPMSAPSPVSFPGLMPSCMSDPLVPSSYKDASTLSLFHATPSIPMPTHYQLPVNTRNQLIPRYSPISSGFQAVNAPLRGPFHPPPSSIPFPYQNLPETTSNHFTLTPTPAPFNITSNNFQHDMPTLTTNLNNGIMGCISSNSQQAGVAAVPLIPVTVANKSSLNNVPVQFNGHFGSEANVDLHAPGTPPVSSGSLTDLSWLINSENILNIAPIDAEIEPKIEQMEPKPKKPTEPRPLPPTPLQTVEYDYSDPYQRPPFSYLHLAMMAINAAPDKRGTLKEVIAWVEFHFPYYQFCMKQWKSCIRHVLTNYNIFVREEPSDFGGIWKLDFSKNSPKPKGGKKRLVKPSQLDFFMKYFKHKPVTEAQEVEQNFPHCYEVEEVVNTKLECKKETDIPD